MHTLPRAARYVLLKSVTLPMSRQALFLCLEVYLLHQVLDVLLELLPHMLLQTIQELDQLLLLEHVGSLSELLLIAEEVWIVAVGACHVERAVEHVSMRLPVCVKSLLAPPAEEGLGIAHVARDRHAPIDLAESEPVS